MLKKASTEVSQPSVYLNNPGSAAPPAMAITGKPGSGKGFYAMLDGMYARSYSDPPLATLDYEAVATSVSGEKFSLHLLANLNRNDTVFKAYCCTTATELDYTIALCRAHPTFKLDHDAVVLGPVLSEADRTALTAYLEARIVDKQFTVEAVMLAEEMKSDAFTRLLKARQRIRREDAETAAASRGDMPIAKQRRRR